MATSVSFVALSLNLLIWKLISNPSKIALKPSGEKNGLRPLPHHRPGEPNDGWWPVFPTLYPEQSTLYGMEISSSFCFLFLPPFIKTAELFPCLFPFLPVQVWNVHSRLMLFWLHICLLGGLLRAGLCCLQLSSKKVLRLFTLWMASKLLKCHSPNQTNEIFVGCSVLYGSLEEGGHSKKELSSLCDSRKVQPFWRTELNPE